MALIEFKNKPDTTTPINATNLNNNFNELNNNVNALNETINDIYNQIWPIGRGFIDFTNTDYSNYLGFTWERTLLGLTPIGHNPDDTDFNEVGKTLGSKTHRHLLPVGSLNNADNVAVANAYGTSDTTASGYARYANASYSQNAGSIRLHYSSTDSNIQPSQVVAFWKRIA